MNPFSILARIPSIWRRSAPVLGRSRRWMIVLVVASALAGILEAVLLGVIAEMAVSLTAGETSISLDAGPFGVAASFSTVLLVAATMVAARMGLGLLQAWIPAWISADVFARMRHRVVTSFVRARWDVQSTMRDGRLQAIGGHVANVSQTMLIVAKALGSLAVLATMLGSAVVLSPLTALLLMVATVGMLAVLRPVGARTKRHAKELSDESIDFSQNLQEVVLLAEEMKVFGAGPDFESRMGESLDRIRSAMFRTRRLAAFVPQLYQGLALGLVVAALFVVWRIDAELASLGAVILVLLRSLSYGQQLQGQITNVQEHLPFIDRLRAEIRELEGAAVPAGAAGFPERMRSIRFVGVSYTYGTGPEVLKDVSFTVSAGETIGIVGPSGAGKSTLVQLLLGLREPIGSVLIDEIEAASIDREQWRRRVSYVPQEPKLLHASVSENIRFFRPWVSDESVRMAARAASIDEQVRSWPKGYDTVIGQRAEGVSGGQRQRICLARALAGDPEMLVLDEPTSALDLESELAVQDALKGLRGRVTLFIVSHRLSTLRNCDRVMVVADGRVQAFDEAAKLQADNEFYRRALSLNAGQGKA